MSVSSVTFPSFADNRGPGRRLRGPLLTGWSGSCPSGRVRQALVLCMLCIACGGTPTTPTPSQGAPLPSPAPAASSNPGSPSPNPGSGSNDVRLEDDLGGRLLFPSDNWWNEDISAAPV